MSRVPIPAFEYNDMSTPAIRVIAQEEVGSIEGALQRTIDIIFDKVDFRNMTKLSIRCNGVLVDVKKVGRWMVQYAMRRLLSIMAFDIASNRKDPDLLRHYLNLYKERMEILRAQDTERFFPLAKRHMLFKNAMSIRAERAAKLKSQRPSGSESLPLG